MKLTLFFAHVIFCLLVLAGCSSVRPAAQRGIDLLENTERSYSTRVPAAIGSAVGQVVGIPLMVLLLPSYPFEVYGWGVREPTEADGTAAPPDYAVPLVLVPLEYGAGLGASVFGYPSAAIEEAIAGPPALDEGGVDEEPESLTGTGTPDAEVASAGKS